MKKILFLLVVLSICLLGSALTTAQMPGPTVATPPNVLYIFREDVKPARGPQHEKTEHGFAQFWAKGKVQTYYAFEAVSGNATEVLFISGYPSFRKMKKQ